MRKTLRNCANKCAVRCQALRSVLRYHSEEVKVAAVRRVVPTLLPQLPMLGKLLPTSVVLQHSLARGTLAFS